MADPTDSDLHLSETPCRRGSLTPRQGGAIILLPALLVRAGQGKLKYGAARLVRFGP
jgi:hypothetical protein